MTADPRFFLVPDPAGDARIAWIQDGATLDPARDSDGPLGEIAVALPDEADIACVPLLDSEAAIVLTVARADAATLTARLVACLNAPPEDR